MNPMGALEASAVGQAMRQWLWLYPAVEVVHILGIALLFGSIVVMDLRLLGVWNKVSVRPLAAQVLPCSAAAFLLIVPSGLLMFVAHARELIASPVFAVKMCLIMAALLNVGIFHAVTFRTADVWDSPQMRNLKPPPSARVAGALSLVLWTSVIACGRFLVYF